MVTHNPNPLKQWTAFFIMLIALALLFGLMSCSPQKRLNRLHKKHPELFRVDTITITDSVFIAEVKTDTLFHTKAGDTVIVTKDRLSMRYIHLPGDTVKLEGECAGDTIVRVIEIPVDRAVITKEFKWWPILLLAGIVLLLAFILRR